MLAMMVDLEDDDEWAMADELEDDDFDRYGQVLPPRIHSTVLTTDWSSRNVQLCVMES